MLTLRGLGTVGGLATAFVLLIATRPAAAQGVGRRPMDQPRYQLELEPHLVVGPGAGPGPDAGSGVGVGVRAGIMLSQDGFIPGVNDSIAIGFGVDALRYGGRYDRYGGWFGTCVRREEGPAGTSVCTEVDAPGAPGTYLSLPVVMQWNFWLTEKWSAFVEPGIDVYFGHHYSGISPSFSFGGRVRLSDAFALILRVGAPTTTFGATFFF